MAARLADAIALVAVAPRGAHACLRALMVGAAIVLVLLVAAALAQCHRALSVRPDAHPRPLLAAQPALPRRHRRIWPRRVQPRADRLATVAAARRHRHADQHGHRRAAGHAGGLPPRADRRSDHARAGHHDGVPADHAGAADPGGHATEPDEDRLRYRRAVRAADRAGDAQHHPRPDERRIHGGRARPRRTPALRAAGASCCRMSGRC